MSVRRGRGIYLAVHKYVGLVLGLWIALVGITGSLLIYQRELEAWQHPDLYRPVPGDTRLGFDAIAAGVAAAFPAHRIAGIERDLVDAAESWKVFLQPASAAGGSTVIVRERQLTVFVDPFRGTILGEQHGPTWLDSVRDFHVELLIGRAGITVVGLAGAATLVSILAGVVLWWPSPKRFAKAFTLRWTANTRLPRKMWDLHHVFGIYALVVLLLVTSTGIVLEFQSETQRLAAHFVDIRPAQAAPVEAAGGGAVTADGATAVVMTRYPGATIRRLAPPTDRRPTYLFQLVPAGRSNLFTTNVHVNAATGQIAYVFDPARQAPARSFIGLWSVFLHNGAAVGPIGRVIVLLSGLIFAALFATGVYIWAKKI